MPAGSSGKGERLMYYKNARIFASDFQFHTGSFQVEDGRFGAVLYGETPEDAVDLKGATVIPGLVDAQARKPMGKLEQTAKELASWGVTAFACAADADEYSQIEGGSRFLGLRLENVAAESFDAFAALVKGSAFPVCMAALPANASFLGKASSLCSIALCDAGSSYEQARDGFAAGASFLQDLYQYLPLVTADAPGAIAAAVENPNVKAELVCAQGRCHPALARLAFAMFGAERLVLSSGGAEENLCQVLLGAIRYGIPEADALRAATYNAACALGAGKEIGMIAPGRKADFVVCRSDFSGRRVFIAGEEI